jgi:hypothetical protein
MIRTRRTTTVSVALTLGLVVSLGLSACATESDPNASSSSATTEAASPTSTPTPTPTSKPRASAIVIGMTSMTVLDAQGNVMQELSYGTPGGDVAFQLDQIFGEEPVETDSAGSYESWPTHNYNWNGFELRDELRDETKQHPYWEYYLYVTTASVNGVEIRTVGGSHVGDPAANVVFDATSPWPPATYDGVTCGAEALHSENGNVLNSVALYLCNDDATALVSRFSVPVPLQV